LISEIKTNNKLERGRKKGKTGSSQNERNQGKRNLGGGVIIGETKQKNNQGEKTRKEKFGAPYTQLWEMEWEKGGNNRIKELAPN